MTPDAFEKAHYTVTFSNFTDTHYLLPFGDVHEANPNCHTELWQEWCDWAEDKERAIFIGMGDYMELFSDTERMGMNSIRLHQSSKHTIDDFAKDLCHKFAKRISFMKNKLLGLLEGNHFYQFENGMTSTQYVCQILDCKYLGATAFGRISFSYSKAPDMTASVDIFAHHGKGASRLVGGSLNTVQQMAECADANIYLMGHDHKKSIGMSSKMCLTHGSTGLHIREKKQVYVRTGSFLKGYEEGKSSYVAKALLNPADLGTVKIELTPRLQCKYKNRRRVSNKFIIDIHASI